MNRLSLALSVAGEQPAAQLSCRLHVLSDPSFHQPALCGQGEYSPQDALKRGL